MDDKNAQEILLRELTRFFAPIATAKDGGIGLEGLLSDLALAVDGNTAVFAQVRDAFVRLGVAASALDQLADPPPETFDDLVRALGSVAQVVAAIAQLPSALAMLPGTLSAGLPRDLLDLMVVRWLNTYHPVAYQTLTLLTIVTPPEQGVERPAILDAAGTVIRPASRRVEIDLGRITKLLTDPARTLLNYYVGPSGLGDAAHTRQVADLFLPRLQMWLRTLGADAALGAPVASDADPLAKALAQQILVVTGSPTVPDVGAAISLAGADQGNLGLVIAPIGVLSRTLDRPDWTVEIGASISAGGVAIGGAGLSLPDGHDAVTLSLTVTKKASTAGAAVMFGAAAGTHLEIGTVRVAVAASLTDQATDLNIMVDAGKAAIVIAGGDGDGFLSHVLPADGLRADFDLGIGWSRSKGLHIRGAAAIEATLPVHVSIGPLNVESVYFRLRIDEALHLALAATGSVTLGPITATIERMGLETDLTFEPGGGNLGPANLAPGFKPPDGAGLVLSAGPVVGGGYLFFDRANKQYAGVLQLEFKGIALKAVGIITTRMPDGTDAFSMLLIISAEFTPIQLGYGFTLNGVGGLIGINRTAALDVLRAGIKARTLDSIMFPRDPVANAPQLISNLSAVFPPVLGRFVIGPMARLGWGTPTLITLDLGLLLELPAPVRLAVLGRLRMVLPSEDAAIVEIHMDVLGVVDFQRGEISIDATLYDSRIAAFTLTGDMALRAGWLDHPGFAMSAGGFHPRFQPPAGFPALGRLALSLGTGDNPRLRLESYLALTSNTAQFGARLEVYAAAAGSAFSIEGVLAFDALFQFDPFSLLVEMVGSVALKHGSTVLMGVSVEITLSGPAPWHAFGRARFQILLISVEIHFDIRTGDAQPQQLPPPEDVEGKVALALAEPRNWSAQLPPEGESVVTLRQIPAVAGEFLVHPLGTISVLQRVAPLGQKMDRFGNARISGLDQMDILKVRVGGTVAETDPITADFAPAQFLDMSDAAKLDSASFVKYEAGCRLRAGGIQRDMTPLVESSVAPKPLIIDEPDTPARAVPAIQLPREHFLRSVAVSAAARAPIRTTGPGRFGGPALALGVRE